MCKRQDCNWFKHLIGICEHNKEADTLKRDIMMGKDEDLETLKKVNRRVSFLIEQDAIDMTVGQLEKITKGNGHDK